MLRAFIGVASVSARSESVVAGGPEEWSTLMVRCTVKDTGISISEADLGNLFQASPQVSWHTIAGLISAIALRFTTHRLWVYAAKWLLCLDTWLPTYFVWTDAICVCLAVEYHSWALIHTLFTLCDFSPAGGRVTDAQLRRLRSRPRDQQTAGGSYGRPDVGRVSWCWKWQHLQLEHRSQSTTAVAWLRNKHFREEQAKHRALVVDQKGAVPCRSALDGDGE